MTVNFSSLTTKGGVAAFPQTTSSVSLTSGVPVILWADIEWSAGTAPTPTITASTGESTAGGEIIPITSGADSATQIWGASDEKRISAWRFTPGSTAARTFQFATPSGTVTSYRLGVIEVTGQHTSSFIGTVKVAEITSGPTVTVTFTPSDVDSGTLYIGAHRQTGTPTLLGDLVHLQQVSNANGLAKIGVASTPETNPACTFSASGRGAAIAIEVLAPDPVADDVIVPVDISFTITDADLPVVDPGEPPEVTPPIIEVEFGVEQSTGARPNATREMDLRRMVADVLSNQRSLQSQIIGVRGSHPHVTADPDDPQNGQSWVRSDTGEYCWVADGVVYRLTGTAT